MVVTMGAETIQKDLTNNKKTCRWQDLSRDSMQLTRSVYNEL